MTVAVAVSHAMFSARFDRGAMSAADRSIGCAGRTVVEAVARPARTLPKKIKPTFVTAVTQALAGRVFVVVMTRARWARLYAVERGSTSENHKKLPTKSGVLNATSHFTYCGRIGSSRQVCA
jgi:hypothetical protein